LLEEILKVKRAEVERAKRATLASELGERAKRAPPARDFAGAIRRAGGRVQVIAEVKFASPAAGVLRAAHDPADVARGYAAAGAAAISVLCDRTYFGGGFEDLEAARGSVTLPLCAKEFIVDPWQVVRARAAGADAVLLVARALEDDALVGLGRVVRSMGMEPLFEAANETEIDRALAAGARVVGVNCRDLSTFALDRAVFDRLLPRIPASCVAVAMSGVSSREDLAALGRTRADAALVGGALMREPDPGEALAAWLGAPSERAGLAKSRLSGT
jgi:indole-3-glycerol phosphate synthase